MLIDGLGIILHITVSPESIILSVELGISVYSFANTSARGQMNCRLSSPFFAIYLLELCTAVNLVFVKGADDRV